MAQSSLFGWVLYGSIASSEVNSDVATVVTSHQLLCFDRLSESHLHQFWNLECIGINDKDDKLSDNVLQNFSENISFVDGRYKVSLPWKHHSKSKLLDNKKLALGRLKQLERKLERDTKLKQTYNQNILDMCNAGIVEEVPPNELICFDPVFYMPHRPVVRESSLTTKVRPVFDCSAKGYNNVSLNDCLETGPCLLSNLTEILIRFRRWRVAIIADIEKAFLQIEVNEQDCNVHRFLWNHDNVTKVMRFRRVPFGNCSSPFLLNATLQHHLSVVPQTPLVKELKDNIYVDDLLTGTDSELDGCQFIKEATEIMSLASFPLTKWGSNSQVVGELLQQSFKDKFVDADIIKVLGMNWLANQDCFSFSGVSGLDGVLITKRVVLSCIARLFDPLGFAAPFVMQAKCLFQELWKLGLSWDEEIPEQLCYVFSKWLDDLQLLRQWCIPRNYTGKGWCDIDHIELLGFGDASPKGYGACIYLKATMKDGTCVCSLVIAKSRVAPLKELSLPRLELLGSLLCAKLLIFVRDALKLSENIEYSCWTDSMVSLSWIRGDPSKWKAFVANRVTSILKLTSSDRWFYCSGDNNPADFLTRGVSAEKLMNSKLWLNGPQNLICENAFSDCISVTSLSSVNDEVFTPKVAPHVLDGPLFDVDRWGSLCKAIRVVAWVMRFVQKLRHSCESNNDLTVDEMQSAKLKLIGCVQRSFFLMEFEALRQGRYVPKTSSLYKLNPFIGEDQLLRVKGRLQFSDLKFDEKHPIILPKCHLAVLLVRFQHVLLKHAGVSTMITTLRNQFWIIGLRGIAKRVKRMCIKCKRFDASSCNPPMAPLPESRVKQACPFAVTGLDHAGPLFCCDYPNKKFYILLFTCGVVRAVHLELVDSVSTSDTVLALRRFVSRRGLPRVLYSDNAKGFRAVPHKLSNLFGPHCPEWKFIAPRSPWWGGGWWERLIRSVKSALKKTLGCKTLMRKELETSLHEVESCINSRPLTFVSDCIVDTDPITPSHFLLGRSSFCDNMHPEPVISGQDLCARLAYKNNVHEKFWVLWTKDYIRNLPQWSGSGSNSGRLVVGSVVLMEQEGTKRLLWPMGIVTRVFPGKDGVIRTVEVKTSTGTYTRSVQRIRDFELISNFSPEFRDTLYHADDKDSVNVKKQDKVSCDSKDSPSGGASNTNIPCVTRSGRCVRPVKRLDL